MRLVIVQLVIHEVLVENLDGVTEYAPLHQRGLGDLTTYSVETRIWSP